MDDKQKTTFIDTINGQQWSAAKLRLKRIGNDQIRNIKK